MNSDGIYREVKSPEEIRLGEVFISGSLEDVEEISRRVKLGAAELERRKSRRKTQRSSRKKNR